MNILPQSTLRIVRQLTDPQDTGTNYVRAVIKNSATGDTLATVDLTDAGTQRFTGSYQTPPDASGLGYYIDITTTVYTDSGYTSKNLNYAIETNTYHVYQEVTHFGGGADIDYKKIRQIIKEEITAQEQPTIPTPRDMTPEMLGMERRIKDALTDAVGSIRIPEQVKPDLQSVVAQIRSTIDDALNTILLAVDNKEVTPETDLTPVMTEVQNIPSQEMLDAIAALNARVETLQEIVNTQQDVNSLKTAAEEFMSKVSPRTLNVPKERPENIINMRARKLLGV